jgi:hypothetical protein
MKKLLILAALAVSLVVSRAGSASPLWSFHATESSSGSEITGTCDLVGAGTCFFSLNSGPSFGGAAPASFGTTLTSTDFRVDIPMSSVGTPLLFPIDPTSYTAGQLDLHLALHDDQGVAFAGVPNTAPALSDLEGATVQFATTLYPTPYLYSLCPSCGGPISRTFTIDALVPEPSPAALALVGLFCLALTRRLTAHGI